MTLAYGVVWANDRY